MATPAPLGEPAPAAGRAAPDGDPVATGPVSTGPGGDRSVDPAAAPPGQAAPPPADAAARTNGSWQVASCPARPPRTRPAPDRPVYDVDVAIDVGARRATGTSTTRFTPDVAVPDIVLRSWPNSPVARSKGGSMTLDSAAVDGRAVPVSSGSDPTLARLARPVAAGATVSVRTTWTIVIPADLSERWSVSKGAVRLGSFVPLLPFEPGVGWATEPATVVHGEATTSPVADWNLTVDARGDDVLATGEQGPDGVWRSRAVRDVGLTTGRFRRATGTVGAGPGGAPVQVVVAADAGVTEDPAVYRDKAVAVLASFARRFGPYPYPVYHLALSAGLSGGIEHPMFVMQGPGSSGRSTSHEIAHQWFYALVGNDQARDPWLDEGLATWAEAGFEGTLAGFRQRSIPASVKGHAGDPTAFFDDRADAYYRGVYVQPTQALAALGSPALVDCVLAAYVDAQAHGISTAAALRSGAGGHLPPQRRGAGALRPGRLSAVRPAVPAGWPAGRRGCGGGRGAGPHPRRRPPRGPPRAGRSGPATARRPSRRCSWARWAGRRRRRGPWRRAPG